MTILVIAEHDNQQVKNSSLHTVNAAKQIDHDIEMIIIGHQCESVAKHCAQLNGIKKVLLADDLVYHHQLAENSAELLKTIAQTYSHILAPATTFGKNLLPRLAALLNVDMLSDVISIITPDTFVRPISAGNALVKVQMTESVKLLTIRTTKFSNVIELAIPVPIEKLTKVFSNDVTTFEKSDLQPSSRPELTTAKTVIAGGRGLKSKENFLQLAALADRLGAAIGATRAAVDAGFAPNDYQVGQTGKIIAPDLYIAMGISGAIQHVAGMKESKTIVAINSDPDAAIFRIADYSVVMDLFTAIKEINAELDKMEGRS